MRIVRSWPYSPELLFKDGARTSERGAMPHVFSL